MTDHTADDEKEKDGPFISANHIRSRILLWTDAIRLPFNSKSMTVTKGVSIYFSPYTTLPCYIIQYVQFRSAMFDAHKSQGGKYVRGL